MFLAVRLASVVVLLMIVCACAFLAVAAREAPPDSWWAFWSLYGAVGLACLVGAVWLLWPKRSKV